MVSSAAARLGLDTEETNPVLLRQMAKRKRQMHARRIASARKKGGAAKAVSAPVLPAIDDRWLQPYEEEEYGDYAEEEEEYGSQSTYSESATDEASWSRDEQQHYEPQLVATNEAPWSRDDQPAVERGPLEPVNQPAVLSNRAMPRGGWGRRPDPGVVGMEAAAHHIRNAPVALLPCGAWPVKKDQLGHRALFQKPELPEQPRRRLAARTRGNGVLSPMRDRQPCTQRRENRHTESIVRDADGRRVYEHNRVSIRRPHPPIRRPLALGSDERRFLWRRLSNDLFIHVTTFLEVRDLGRLACTARRFNVRCIANPEQQAQRVVEHAEETTRDDDVDSNRVPEMWSIPEEGARRQCASKPAHAHTWVVRGTSWMRLLHKITTMLVLEHSALFKPHRTASRDLQASVDDSGTAVIAHSSLAAAEDAGSSSRTGAAVLKTDFSSASFGPPMLRGRHYVETTILEPGTRGCFIGLVPAKSYNHRWVSERASGTSVTFCMRALPRGLCWLTIH
jgi:hypothetical protein